MKTFMIVFGLYIMIMFIYVYKDDGSREHDRNTLLMGIVGVMMLLIYMSIQILFPEIKMLSKKTKKIEYQPAQIEKVSKQLYGEEKKINASWQRSCSCFEEKVDIEPLREFTEKTRSGIMYQLLVEVGRIKIIREKTRVTSYEEEEYKGYIPVMIMEGEYIGHRVYVPWTRLEKK